AAGLACGAAAATAPPLPTSSASAATAALATTSLRPLTVWSFPPRRAPSHFCCKSSVKRSLGRRSRPCAGGVWFSSSGYLVVAPRERREETERRTSTSPRRPRRGRGHRRSVRALRRPALPLLLRAPPFTRRRRGCCPEHLPARLRSAAEGRRARVRDGLALQDRPQRLPLATLRRRAAGQGRVAARPPAARSACRGAAVRERRARGARRRARVDAAEPPPRDPPPRVAGPELRRDRGDTRSLAFRGRDPDLPRPPAPRTGARAQRQAAGPQDRLRAEPRPAGGRVSRSPRPRRRGSARNRRGGGRRCRRRRLRDQLHARRTEGGNLCSRRLLTVGRRRRR